MRNNYEDNYDDSDFYDSAFDDDNLDEQQGADYEEITEDDYSLDDEDELSDKETKDENLNDWQVYGLDEKFEGSYNHNDFELLMLKDVSDQMDAVKYASYFGKHGNTDAKTDLAVLVKKSENGEPINKDVVQLAKTALTLILRNYFRRIIEQFYNGKNFGLTSVQQHERVQEALSTTLLGFFEEIKDYDETKGAITTFFGDFKIKGYIQKCESQRLGRSNKGQIRIDNLVIKKKKELERRGIEPTAQLIASQLGKGVNEIQIALNRIYIENSMSTIDTPEFNNSGGKIEQTVFEQPGEALIKQERTMQLIKALNVLSSEEEEIVFAKVGIICTGTDFLDKKTMTNNELAKHLGRTTVDVERIFSGAISKLRAYYKLEKTERKLDRDNDLLLLGSDFDEDEDDALFLTRIINASDKLASDVLNIDEDDTHVVSGKIITEE